MNLFEHVSGFARAVFSGSVILIGVISNAHVSSACQVAAPIDAEYMVRTADLIVLAIATDYSSPPAGDTVPEWIGTRLSTAVRFEILETLAGTPAGRFVEVAGVLTERDDFNDHQPPYEFVRPAGRRGNCWAYDYKRGASFLLLLKRDGERFRSDWYGLAPVNEQVAGADDPWVQWVRARTE